MDFEDGPALNMDSAAYRDDPNPWNLAITWALLAPLLYFLVQGCSPFSNEPAWTRLSQAHPDSEQIVNRLFATLITLFCFSIVLPRWRGLVAIARSNKSIALLPVLAMGLSVFSQEPLHSFSEGFVLLSCTLFALYLFQRYSPTQQMEVMAGVGAIALAGTILFAVFLPQYGLDRLGGHDNAWKGIFPAKNACGIGMLLLLIPAMSIRPRSQVFKIARVFSVLGTLVVIGFSRAATTWLLTLAYFGMVVFFRLIRRFRRRDRTALIVLGVSAVVISALAVLQNFSVILSILGKDPTLTGRTGLWQPVFLSIMRRPLTGYGYEAFWLGMSGESASVITAAGWVMGQSQCGFLDIWLQLGLGGMLLVFSGIAIALTNAVKYITLCRTNDQDRLVEWYLATVVLSVLYNLSESYLVAPTNLFWILFIMAVAGLRRIGSQVNAEPAL
jgi:exopolysaccharide production protein ExoQ